jgi:hypothetical protein
MSGLGPLGGSNHKDITLLKTDVDCGCFECFLGSAYGCRRVRGFSVLSALPLGGANGSIYTNFGVHPCDYGILGLIGLSINRVLVLSALH